MADHADLKRDGYVEFSVTLHTRFPLSKVVDLTGAPPLLAWGRGRLHVALEQWAAADMRRAVATVLANTEEVKARYFAHDPIIFAGRTTPTNRGVAAS